MVRIQYSFKGNDVLNGGEGIDRLVGGKGDDYYYIKGRDITRKSELREDTINSVVDYTLPENFENLTFSMATSPRKGTGNSANNKITGSRTHDELLGLAGNDTLMGGRGNDTLNGGSGVDSMVGGNGNDEYLVNRSSDQVVERSNGGTDLITSSININLGLNRYLNVENVKLVGSNATVAIGNSFANKLTASIQAAVLSGYDGSDTLIGGDGNDFLNGGSGVDSMLGADGNDTYYVTIPTITY